MAGVLSKADGRRQGAITVGVYLLSGTAGVSLFSLQMRPKRLNLLLEFFGAAHVNRTRDPIITNDVLYQLS